MNSMTVLFLLQLTTAAAFSVIGPGRFNSHPSIAVPRLLASTSDVEPPNGTALETVSTVAVAATMAKVAVTTATKAIVTASTFAVAAPALKVATVGASLLQIGLERARIKRQAAARQALEVVAEEMEAAVAAARVAAVGRQEEYSTVLRTRTLVINATDPIIALLDTTRARCPQRRPSIKRLASFAGLGGVAGAVVPGAARLAPLAMALSLSLGAALFASRIACRLNARAHEDICKQASLLTSAALAVEEAELLLAEAKANVSAFIASEASDVKEGGAGGGRGVGVGTAAAGAAGAVGAA